AAPRAVRPGGAGLPLRWWRLPQHPVRRHFLARPRGLRNEARQAEARAKPDGLAPARETAVRWGCRVRPARRRRALLGLRPIAIGLGGLQPALRRGKGPRRLRGAPYR